MNIYKVFIVLFFFSLLSCSKEADFENSCGNLRSFPREFDIIDIQLETLFQKKIKSNHSRIYGDIEYLEDEGAVFDTLVLSLNSITQIKASKIFKNRSFNFSFFNQAYACSPAPPTTKEKIVNISITSSTDFDDSHPSGSSLNSLFDVMYTESETQFYEYDNGQYVYYTVDEYINQEVVNAGYVVQIKLNTEPQYRDNHIFNISISLDGGETFNLKTRSINFKKL